MKSKLLVAFVLCFSLIKATHIESGRMSLEYVGSTTGVANQYKVTVHVFRHLLGIPLGSTINVNVESSCQASQVITLSKDTLISHISSTTECASWNSPTQSFVDQTVFSALVILSSCQDWHLYYNACCRGAFTNKSTTSEGYYFSVNLNNMSNPNSLAIPTDIAPKVFGVGRTYYWDRNYIDADGDSLYITPHAVYQYDDLNGVTNAIDLDTGFSHINPLGTDSSVVFNVDDRNGNLVLKTNTIGNYLIGFKIEEYKIDSTFQMFYLGAVHYDETTVSIVQNTQVPVLVKMNNGDTLKMNCGDSKLKVGLAYEFFNTSLTATDFAIYSPAGPTIPIINAEGRGGSTQGRSDSIEFTFYNPIVNNGVYELELRTGLDGNTLILPCGTAFDHTERVFIKVNNCAVSIAENELNFVKIYPMPAQDQLTIELKSDASTWVKIFDTQGRLVFKKAYHTKLLNCNLNDLPIGNYTVELAQGNSYKRTPLIIAR